MNTNPTAISLAVILNSLNRLHGREIIEDLSVGQAAERQAAYFTGINAVEHVGTKNGNTLTELQYLADLLALVDNRGAAAVEAAAEIIRRRADQ